MRGICRAGMDRNKWGVIVFLLVLLTGVLTGCSEKGYVVECGVYGYAYQVRLFQFMDGI